MVVLCTHAPFRGADKKGFKEVLGLLTQFKDAELLIGHTHHPEIYRHDDFRCLSGRPVKEHIHGAVCGAWWHANICVDGTPSGYAVYQVSGDHFTDYTARFTGLDEGVQLRVYNGNQSYFPRKAVTRLPGNRNTGANSSLRSGMPTRLNGRWSLSTRRAMSGRWSV